MSDKSFPLENLNIFVKCLRKSHTVAIGNDFPVFYSPSAFKTQNHPSFRIRIVLKKNVLGNSGAVSKIAFVGNSFNFINIICFKILLD